MNLSSAGQAITEKDAPKPSLRAPGKGKVLTINLSSAVIDAGAEWLEVRVDGETIGWYSVTQ